MNDLVVDMLAARDRLRRHAPITPDPTTRAMRWLADVVEAHPNDYVPPERVAALAAIAGPLRSASARAWSHYDHCARARLMADVYVVIGMALAEGYIVPILDVGAPVIRWTMQTAFGPLFRFWACGCLHVDPAMGDANECAQQYPGRVLH